MRFPRHIYLRRRVVALGLLIALWSACTPLESADEIVAEPADNGDSETPAQGLPFDAATDRDGGAGSAGPDSTGEDAQLPDDGGAQSYACTAFDNGSRLMRLLADGALPPLDDNTGGDAGAAALVSDAGAVDTTTLPLCEAVAPQGKVVYVTGSTAAKPFLQVLGPQLASRGVSMVYASTGSCAGVDAVLNSTPMRTGPAPLPSSATYWDGPTSSGTACRLPEQGVAADIGISDVFAQTCPGFELVDLRKAGVRDASGPIQTMAFVVPTRSRHREISAEAAYFVFGFGQSGGVLDSQGMPAWNDERFLFRRSPSSGTQALLAAAIGVHARAWKGQANATSDDVARGLLNAAAAPAEADLAIGILGDDYLQVRNLQSQLRVLAYQDTQRTCAMYPDSTDTARDKLNVREGRYPLWGPLHLLHRVDDDGVPVRRESREAVTDILGYLSGTKPLPNGVQLIDLYAESGLIPECAMKVSRAADGGKLSPSRPALPCACLFEQKATGATSCKPCRVQGECADKETCALGYCERPD